jgi:hypothetical protein
VRTTFFLRYFYASCRTVSYACFSAGNAVSDVCTSTFPTPLYRRWGVLQIIPSPVLALPCSFIHGSSVLAFARSPLSVLFLLCLYVLVNSE